MTATDVFFALVMYALGLFSVYFLLNYAVLTAKPAAWLKATLGSRWGYPLSCAFCFGVWSALFAWAIGVIPFLFVFALPPLHLLLDTVYDRLNTPPPLPPA